MQPMSKCTSVIRMVTLAMMLPAVASAQTGTIAGVVKDATGAVLPGVTVEAASPALGISPGLGVCERRHCRQLQFFLLAQLFLLAFLPTDNKDDSRGFSRTDTVRHLWTGRHP